jgi:hypothetical protein
METKMIECGGRNDETVPDESQNETTHKLYV